MRRLSGNSYSWVLMLFVGVWLVTWALWGGQPAELRAELVGPSFYAGAAPGDSVRYVLRFTPPATAVDSVVLKWDLGGNPTQIHVRRPPFPAAVDDTARFESPPLSAGGSTATGNVVIQVWRTGVGSPGVTRAYTVTRPGPTAPPDVTGVLWVDSAVVYP